MNKFIIAVLALAVLSGCGTQGFNHPNATQAQYEKDRYECIQVASGSGSVSGTNVVVNRIQTYGSSMPSCALWEGCLKAKGYVGPSLSGRLKTSGGGSQCQ